MLPNSSVGCSRLGNLAARGPPENERAGNRISAVEKVKATLSAYPGVRYSEPVDGIEIHATDASGFGVGLRITPAGFTVHFEGWHEEFASEDEALNCLAGVAASDNTEPAAR